MFGCIIETRYIKTLGLPMWESSGAQHFHVGNNFHLCFFLQLISFFFVSVEAAQLRLVGEVKIDIAQGRPFGFEVECVTADGDLVEGNNPIMSELFMNVVALISMIPMEKKGAWTAFKKAESIMVERHWGGGTG